MSERKLINLAGRLYKRCRGASMLELALGIIVVISLIVGIIDFARVLAIRGALVYGAHRGLNIAVKDLDVTIDGRACPNPPPPDCPADGPARYQAARQKVLDAAHNPPMVIPDQVIFIRPGEHGHAMSPECDDTQYGANPPYNYYRSLLEHCPVQVEEYRTVDLLIPGMPSIQLVGRAFGYHESSTTHAAAGGPLGTPTATPTPGPTRTPRPVPTSCPPLDCDPPPNPNNFPNQRFCCDVLAGGSGCQWDEAHCRCICGDEGEG